MSASKGIVKWSKLEEAHSMDKRSYERLMESFKSDPKSCSAWRKMSCEGGPDCQLSPRPEVRGYYSRNVVYDPSVNDELRFGCDFPTDIKVATIILLVSSYGNKVGFPKGSIDLEDRDPMFGAMRETLEETGIPLTHIVPRDVGVGVGVGVESHDEFIPFKLLNNTVFFYFMLRLKMIDYQIWAV